MAQFDGSRIKNIGVYASGGDAPGMNAAIRAVVRTAIVKNLSVTGFIGGYTGIVNNDAVTLDLRSVANIIQRGGSILKAGRSPEFMQPDGRRKAVEVLRSRHIDGLICIGGDGSMNGAHLLWSEHKIPIVCIPGTIDNDIYGSDNTIGFDTAINTAVDAIDRIRDTAASHDRLFIVEVMGRDSGFIAIAAGLAGGAEDIFIPEHPFNIDKTLEIVNRGLARGKTSSILVTAEGHKPGRAYDLAEAVRKHSGMQSKVCILGHIQRGGSPTAIDRILASRMASAAVHTLLSGHCDVMIGSQGETLLMVDLNDALKKKKNVNQQLIELAQILSN